MKVLQLNTDGVVTLGQTFDETFSWETQTEKFELPLGPHSIVAAVRQALAHTTPETEHCLALCSE